MSIQHTPGPWVIDEQVGTWTARLVGTPPKTLNENLHSLIAEVYGTFEKYAEYKVERDANARLIAAAPETAAERDRLREINKELLEACKFAFSVSVSHPDMGNNTEFNELRETLRAAIAKAEKEGA